MNRVAGLTALALAGLAVRLYAGRESFWLDEMTAVEIAEKSIPDIWRSLQVTQHAPILDYLLLHLVSRLTDWDPAYWGPSLLFGLLSFPLIWAAVREWTDEPTAWWAAGFLVFAALPVRYSLEARMYSLWLFGLLGTGWALGRIARRPEQTKPLLEWGAWSLLVLYIHSFGALLFALETVFVVILARSRWKSGAVVVAVGILYAPQAAVLFARASESSQVGEAFTWSLAGPVFFWDRIFSELGPSWPYGSALFAVLAAAGLAFLLREGRYGVAAGATAWLALPTLAVLHTLHVEETFFAPRYFIFLCAVGLPLAALGARRLLAAVPVPGAAPTGALLLAAWAVCGIEKPRGDVWLPLLEPVLEDASAEAVLIADGGAAAPYPRVETAFYFRNHPLRRNVGLLPPDAATFADLLRLRPNAWVVHLERTPLPSSVAALLAEGFESVAEKEGHRLLRRREGFSPADSPPPTDRLVPLHTGFGESLELLGYSFSPWTARPGDFVTLALAWRVRNPPELDWSIAARADRVETSDGKRGRIRFDHYPFSGVNRFPDWKPGEQAIERWTVRVPPGQPEGPTELSLKLERNNQLGSHHPDLPFYQVVAWTPEGSTEPILVRAPGPEISPSGDSPDLIRARIGPRLVSGQLFEEGGKWLGATIGREGEVVIHWEGTDRVPPPRSLTITLADPATRAVWTQTLASTRMGRSPSTLAPGDRAAYRFAGPAPVALRTGKVLLLVGTADPQSGERVEQYSLQISGG